MDETEEFEFRRRFELENAQPKSPTLRESFERGAGLVYRAVAPTLAGAQIGSYGGGLGAVLGATAVPAADAVNATANALAPAAAVFCATPTAVNAFAKPKLRAV